MQRTLSLIALAIACCLDTNAQITEIGHIDARLMELSTLRTAGKKFASPVLGAPFNIYNLDLSVYTTITAPTFTPPLSPIVMMHITEDLFDTDPSTIEYLVMFVDPTTSPWVNGSAVYRQDGTELFYSFPGSASLVNTPGGVLMVVDTATSISQPASVLYLLPGVMPCQDCSGNLSVGMAPNDQIPLPSGNVLAFPNPSNDAARIDYALPAGTKHAELVLHAMNGQLVKQIPLTGPAGQMIMLTTHILPAGTYTYHIVADGQMLVGDRLVVVH